MKSHLYVYVSYHSAHDNVGVLLGFLRWLANGPVGQSLLLTA